MLMFACAQALAAEGVDITHAHIEATEEGYRLAASYAFDLNHGIEEAIQYGSPVYFTSEIELTRPRWYWYDDKAVSARQTVRIQYNVLTREYHVMVLGSMQQKFATLDDAMVLVRRPSRWLIAPKGALKKGETYNVTLRMFMDREQLPKTTQLSALNNSQWRLTSKNKNFPYTAE
jgi:hypothetical protein